MSTAYLHLQKTANLQIVNKLNAYGRFNLQFIRTCILVVDTKLQKFTYFSKTLSYHNQVGKISHDWRANKMATRDRHFLFLSKKNAAHPKR